MDHTADGAIVKSAIEKGCEQGVLCSAEGPNHISCTKQAHETGMHEFKNPDTGRTRMWSMDWKRNDHRLTWHS